MTETELDIPVPPSVNRTRKVHWAGHREYVEWKKQAGWSLVENGQLRKAMKGIGRHELTIILNEDMCAKDQDNPIKAAGDFLVAMGIILDDSPKFRRRTIIEWGFAPAGCRLIVRELP
jgi:hypothetical protein